MGFRQAYHQARIAKVGAFRISTQYAVSGGDKAEARAKRHGGKDQEKLEALGKVVGVRFKDQRFLPSPGVGKDITSSPAVSKGVRVRKGFRIITEQKTEHIEMSG